MSTAETDGLLAEIEDRMGALDRAQKQLKRPSTLAFAERRDLTTRAAKAREELEARRSELSAEGAGEAAVGAAREALESAATVLSRIEAAQPAGLQRSGTARMLPGDQRRGTSSGSPGRPAERRGE